LLTRRILPGNIENLVFRRLRRQEIDEPSAHDCHHVRGDQHHHRLPPGVPPGEHAIDREYGVEIAEKDHEIGEHDLVVRQQGGD